MKVQIKENGQIEELSIYSDGINYINDLMGNHGALPDYDDETDAYIMDQESYEWWQSLTTNLQAAEDRLDELDLRESFQDSGIGDCDLEDLPRFINQFCDEQ